MQAVVCRKITEDLSGVRLDQIDQPCPGPDDVLVKVAAASVNFPDILTCQGLYQHRPSLPFVPGMNLAGKVVGVGANVTDIDVGERVCGSAKVGAFAQFAVLPATAVQTIPAAMNFAAAASYPSAYLTAYVSLVRRANLQAGETVLVHGAAGGVGLATVDLAKLMGATVIATASTPEKRAFLDTYGADHVLDVTVGFREEVKRLTQGRGADVIFDPVGGDVFDESTRCIAFDGRLLVVGFTSGRIAEISSNIPLIKGFSVVGVRAGEYGRRFPERGRENVVAIWKLAQDGKTRPHIHAELDLSDWKRGFEMLRTRNVIGKVVLLPDHGAEV